MKKVLFFVSSMICLSLSAQTIVTENFSSLTAGNLATDLTGTTAGQGGYKIFGGAVTDYQVTTVDASHGNSLQIISGDNFSSTANTYNRFAFKGITPVTATTGNNILKGSIDIYTGPATGAGRITADLYDATSGIVGIGYDYATKKIVGKARLTLISTGATAYYSINLTQTNTYPANTWVSVTFTYNKTTGAYTWITPEGTFTFTNSLYSLSPGLDPTEYDFISSTLTGNTVANTASLDNFSLQYTNTSTLGITDVKTVGKVGIAIYPNPTSDILNINSDSKVISVSVVDLTGKKANVRLEGTQVDVRSLPAGTYLINVGTKDGISTEKFIKK
ncbi:T9SS type A sorting domain-containing protein [Chryseobacterium formosus]|uniref:T9SS type A sorting domain-containing protein n=1 Tax=Chryseobacterium formosus TaxID=1537363 RepID=A0ABT3XMS4_9FLAO|nr:T9SS type A sorting domain-containing protein [Chryseobacterium formosus]MCX8523417.1 T9SS type A sorting domain-containing protein [Chryseobacterium formosus]